MNEKFWEWLLEEGKKIKLPMVGAPTLDVYLRRKYNQWKKRKYGE